MYDINECPICGHKELTQVREGYYFRGNRKNFTIKECRGCNLWITTPRPDEGELDDYYNTDDYVSHTDGSKGVMDVVYNMVRNYAVKAKLNLLESFINKGSLLDYGAGTGVFMQGAKKRGWKVKGIEVNPLARENAAARGLELFGPEYLDKIAKESFEAITLWHVLEHLDNPLEWTKTFAEKLKPGAVLIYALPNHESLDSKIYGNDWAALDLPLHLYHFKKKNISDLAKASGLIVEGIHNMPFDAFYVSMLSEKNRGGSILKAFWNAWKSNAAGRVGQNQSSLIYVLRKP